ncbi:hypothetical protein [Paenibacillus tuaregi]|nr:hypothetical protein [Paenibacillus tuaregi]
MMPLIMLGLYLVLIVAGIYAIFLFIALAKRGIRALDIYLDEKTNQK